MNAAFLLVTTAWFAGADAAPATPAAPAVTTPAVGGAPLVSTPAAGSCCGGGGAVGNYAGGCGCNEGCGCGCEVSCCKQGCLQRLRARFQRNSCCSCCETCNTCNTCNTYGNVVSSCCNSGCGSSYAGSACCGFDGGCGACCETSCRQGCLARLRARRASKNCCNTCNTCCESACGGCASGSCGGANYGVGVGGVGVGGVGVGVPGTTVMPPAGEQLKTLPKDATPGKKLPSGDNNKGQVQSHGADLTPTSSNAIETETKNPFELDRRYETRVDRAADYGWVTGQLFYVHADGGLWVLRYAPLGKEDPNGGSVVLSRDRQMDSYREGDLVKVHGEILNAKGSIFLGGPLYRVDSIELIDRNTH